VVDGTVDGFASRQCRRGVPDVKRKSQRFPTETLCQDDTLRTTFRHIGIEEGHWGSTISGRNWETVDGDDPGTLFFWRKQDSRNFNYLRFRRRRRSNYVIIGLCRNALFAMTRPITLEVLRRTVPGLLATGAPHRRGPTAQSARVINEWARAHSVSGR